MGLIEVLTVKILPAARASRSKSGRVPVRWQKMSKYCRPVSSPRLVTGLQVDVVHGFAHARDIDASDFGHLPDTVLVAEMEQDVSQVEVEERRKHGTQMQKQEDKGLLSHGWNPARAAPGQPSGQWSVASGQWMVMESKPLLHSPGIHAWESMPPMSVVCPL